MKQETALHGKGVKVRASYYVGHGKKAVYSIVPKALKAPDGAILRIECGDPGSIIDLAFNLYGLLARHIDKKFFIGCSDHDVRVAMGKLPEGWKNSGAYDVPIFSMEDDESDRLAKRLDRGEIVKVEKNIDRNLLADISASLKKDLLDLMLYEDKRDKKVWWLKGRKTARRIALESQEKKQQERLARTHKKTSV